MDQDAPPPDYNISWAFPVLRNPPCGETIWNVASNFTLCTVGTIAKIFLIWLNRTRCHNVQTLSTILRVKPSHVPLLTISNHISRFDDPGMWACLGYRFYNRKRMRWSLAAHDICFYSKLVSYLFLLGKCIPIIRGGGVHQEGVDFCIEQLKKGEWVHVFPEGQIKMDTDPLRLKWGVGRIIYESPVTPIIIPIWTIGMERVVPVNPPYIPKFGQKITFNFGDPVDLTEFLRELRETVPSEAAARRIITERIQEELLKLKEETEILHKTSHSI